MLTTMKLPNRGSRGCPLSEKKAASPKNWDWRLFIGAVIGRYVYFIALISCSLIKDLRFMLR